MEADRCRRLLQKSKSGLEAVHMCDMYDWSSGAHQHTCTQANTYTLVQYGLFTLSNTAVCVVHNIHCWFVTRASSTSFFLTPEPFLISFMQKWHVLITTVNTLTFII